MNGVKIAHHITFGFAVLIILLYVLMGFLAFRDDGILQGIIIIILGFVMSIPTLLFVWLLNDYDKCQ